MRAYVAHGININNPLSTFKYTTTHTVLKQPPTDTSVLVKVAYARVNPADIQYVNGVYQHAPAHPMPRFPCPLGVDGSGVVVAVGSKVTKFKLGDHVLGLHQRMDEGTWAEVAAFEESELAVKPAGVCWQLAAAAPVAGVTALSALLCCPALKQFYTQHSSSSSNGSRSSSVAPIQSALVLGASGGVGSFAVLLLKHYFKVPLVMATCSGRNAEYVQKLGADVVIDYTMQGVAAAVADTLQHRQRQCGSAAGGTVQHGASRADQEQAAQASVLAADAARPPASSNKGSDISSKLELVIDNVGGSAHMSMACKLLTPDAGVHVTSVPLANPQSNSLWSVLAFFASIALRKALHSTAPARFPAVAFNGASPDGAKLQRLVDWLAAADGVVHGGSVEQCLLRLTEFDLQDAGQALAAVQSKRTVGKLVLRVAGWL
jgi:NADPH:quinone reductase-like Zn-dependent oxidoreductase